MSRVAICGNSTDSRAMYLSSIQLPERYMEDFTLMGLVVDDYQRAVALVRDAGFDMDERGGAIEVGIDSPKRIMQIYTLLSSHKVHCDFSDIADTIYQA